MNLASMASYSRMPVDDYSSPNVIDISKVSGASAPPQKDQDQLDRVMAEALNQLSMNDREKVFQEIHGVADAIEETSELVDRSLYELNEALERIKQGSHNFGAPRLNAAAYLLAESLSLEFVQDRKLRLRFLRAEDFDPTLAAERMIRFFDFKLALFGKELLVKDTSYSDLGRDIEFFEKGIFQFLPERDRAGRPVLVIFPSGFEYTRMGPSWTNTVGRLYFYILSMIDDETLVKRGLVFMIYGVDVTDFKEFDPMVPALAFRAFSSMPAKIIGLHFCFNHPWFRVVAQNIIHMASALKTKASGKLHQGSQQEVMYSLMSYGIPTADFPVNFDNTIKCNNHKDMIKMQRKKEVYVEGDQGKDLEYIILPDNFDVLFGKGATYHQRPGNMRLKMYIDELLPLQSAMTSRKEKAALVDQVVASVTEGGGHFLSKESGVWMAVQDDVARSKVSNLFRNRKKVAQQQVVVQQENSIMSTVVRSNDRDCGGFFALGNHPKNKRQKSM